MHIVNICIQKDYIKTYKYLKIISKLKLKKNVNIEFLNTEQIICDNQKIIICDSTLNIKNSCQDFILALKKILNSLDTTKLKMKFLEDMCKNIPIIIFSCGPSSNIDFNKINDIQNDYIIIAVKYIYNKLIANNIRVDFALKSMWDCNLQDSYNIKTGISIYISSKPDKSYDLNFCPAVKLDHLSTFSKLLRTKNLDIIKITENKIFDTHVSFNLAHIMLEVAIPISIFMGVNNIFTFGWDGPVNNKYVYFNNIISQTPIVIQQTEYKYMEAINKLFIDNNINVYKGNKNSPIDLRYNKI